MTTARVKVVLFDLDGTLLDTAPDMAAALNALRASEGLGPLPFCELRPLVSHGASALVRCGFPRATEAQFADLRARFIETYGRALLVQTRPFAGLLEALARLEAAGLRWGIVTNKPEHLTGPLLERLGLSARASVVVSGDTLAQRKPHPAQLLHAVQALGLSAHECIYIGDAERDVLAAYAADIPVFVALYGYIPAHESPLDWPAQGWLDSPQTLIGLLDSLCDP